MSKEIYKSALDTFGVEHQVLLAFEEMGELTDQLAKHFRDRATKEGIITELADVSIMVEQLALHFGWKEYKEEKERKIRRLERIIKWQNTPAEERREFFGRKILDCGFSEDTVLSCAYVKVETVGGLLLLTVSGLMKMPPYAVREIKAFLEENGFIPDAFREWERQFG